MRSLADRLHRLQKGHWPEPVVAGFTPYACRICSADEIDARRRRQSEMEREVSEWNARVFRRVRERGYI